VVADIAHIRAPGAQNILEETQRLAKGDVMSREEADICMSCEEEDAYLAKVTRRNQICSELLVHPKVKFFAKIRALYIVYLLCSRHYIEYFLKTFDSQKSVPEYCKRQCIQYFRESASCLVHLHVAGVRHKLDQTAQEKLERGLLLLRVLFRPLRLARYPTQHLQARLQGHISSSKQNVMSCACILLLI
jgi:hypothetical protein